MFSYVQYTCTSSSAHAFNRQWPRYFHFFFALIVFIKQIWHFLNFLKVRHFFWKSVKSLKLKFKVIVSIGSRFKDIHFYRPNIVLILIEIIVLFSF